MHTAIQRFPSPIDKHQDGTYVYQTNEQYQTAANRYIKECSLSPEQVRAAYLKLLDRVGNCM